MFCLTVFWIILRAPSGLDLIVTTLDQRKKLLMMQSGHVERLGETWWMWLIGKLWSHFPPIFKVFQPF